MSAVFVVLESGTVAMNLKSNLRVWITLTLECLNVINDSGSVVPDNCICCLDECPDMISPTDLGAVFNNDKWL